MLTSHDETLENQQAYNNPTLWPSHFTQSVCIVEIATEIALQRDIPQKSLFSCWQGENVHVCALSYDLQSGIFMLLSTVVVSVQVW